MEPGHTEVSATFQSLIASQEPLRDLHRRWEHTGELDLDAFEGAHAVATVAAHRHYYAEIDVYRQLADDLALADTSDADVIRAELTSTDHLFKSYNPQWLDEHNFGKMAQWLAKISTCQPIITESVTGIEQWLTSLANGGTTIRYSSASSGRLSFVPRDEFAQRVQTEMSLKQVDSANERYGVRLAETDACLLSFRGGCQGFAAMAEQVGQSARSQTFLYDFPIDADAVHGSLGPSIRPEHREAIERFRIGTQTEQPKNFARVLRGLADSAARGNQALIYGAPFHIQMLCEILRSRAERLALPDGSCILLAGGWKTFLGQRVSRKTLVAQAVDTLGLDPRMVMEGYGMTECTVRFTRCHEGRFHIPPLIRPMIVDYTFFPKDGPGQGRFAFTDPFATCFPGFLITGDEVNLTLNSCSCGQQGYAIEGEIRRAAGEEIKGCGGVIESIEA